MSTAKCPKCGSSEVMTGVEVRDYGRSSSHPLQVVVKEPEPPQHGLVWIQEESTGEVTASICSRCGYTELYTTNLEELYKSYKKGH